MSSNHEQLADDLAAKLRGATSRRTHFVGREANLGSAWLENGVPRADVLAVRPSYTRFCVSIYEVKASRSDFQADLRAGKWRSYLPFCHRLYFAAPSGVLDKSDVPDGCGLLVRGPKGWSTVLPSHVRSDVSFGVDTLLGILVTCGNEEQVIRRAVSLERSYRPTHRELRATFGAENARRIATLDAETDRARRMRHEYETLLASLALDAGVPVLRGEDGHLAGVYDLTKAVLSAFSENLASSVREDADEQEQCPVADGEQEEEHQ